MITEMVVVLALFTPPGTGTPNCGDWKALAEKADEKASYLHYPQEVFALWRRAAEAAECLQEPPEAIDRLWLRYAGWLSIDHPSEAVVFAEERLKRIRSQNGENHPREAPYLWFEAYTLRHAALDIPRGERAVLKALQIMREAYGEDSPGVAAAHRRVAFFLSDTGRREAGLVGIDQAIRSAERAGKAGRVELCMALGAKRTLLGGMPIPDETEMVSVGKRWLALWDELTAEGWSSNETVW